MPNTQYARFLKHRRIAQRAIGQHLVERVEAGATLTDLKATAGPVYVNGVVKGTDMDVFGCVASCGMARKRIAAALAALRA